MSDEKLFARVKRGDGQALSELYDRHARRVHAIARHLIQDAATVEEVIQDVFTRIWTTQAFDPAMGRFDHWICIVTRRVALDHLRRMRRQSRHVPYEHVDAARDIDVRAAEEELLDNILLRRDLAESMSDLRREDRTVIELAYFQGYTLSEVAQGLGIPIGTVKTRLHRALRSLKSNLADGEEGGT